MAGCTHPRECQEPLDVGPSSHWCKQCGALSTTTTTDEDARAWELPTIIPHAFGSDTPRLDIDEETHSIGMSFLELDVTIARGLGVPLVALNQFWWLLREQLLRFSALYTEEGKRASELEPSMHVLKYQRGRAVFVEGRVFQDADGYWEAACPCVAVSLGQHSRDVHAITSLEQTLAAYIFTTTGEHAVVCAFQVSARGDLMICSSRPDLLAQLVAARWRDPVVATAADSGLVE